jgi:hypothetical protein
MNKCLLAAAFLLACVPAKRGVNLPCWRIVSGFQSGGLPQTSIK